jgi:hypothetical protein
LNHVYLRYLVLPPASLKEAAHLSYSCLSCHVMLRVEASEVMEEYAIAVNREHPRLLLLLLLLLFVDHVLHGTDPLELLLEQELVHLSLQLLFDLPLEGEVEL